MKYVMSIMIILFLTSCAMTNQMAHDFRVLKEGPFPERMIGIKTNIPKESLPNAKQIIQINNQAISRFNEADYQGAYSTFIDALRLAPDDNLLYYNAGICQIKLFKNNRFLMRNEEQCKYLSRIGYLLSESAMRGNRKARVLADSVVGKSYWNSGNIILWTRSDFEWENSSWMNYCKNLVFK